MANKKLMVCEKCKESSEVKVRLSLLGFPRWNCPKCKQENIYPLGVGYRNFYIVLVILGVSIFFYAIGTGRPYTPGLLLIAAIIALYKDNKMRGGPEVTNENSGSSYCSGCGTMLEKDAKFCPSCGIKK